MPEEPNDPSSGPGQSGTPKETISSLKSAVILYLRQNALAEARQLLQPRLGTADAKTVSDFTKPTIAIRRSISEMDERIVVIDEHGKNVVDQLHGGAEHSLFEEYEAAKESVAQLFGPRRPPTQVSNAWLAETASQLAASDHLRSTPEGAAERPEMRRKIGRVPKRSKPVASEKGGPDAAEPEDSKPLFSRSEYIQSIKAYWRSKRDPARFDNIRIRKHWTFRFSQTVTDRLNNPLLVQGYAGRAPIQLESKSASVRRARDRQKLGKLSRQFLGIRSRENLYVSSIGDCAVLSGRSFGYAETCIIYTSVSDILPRRLRQNLTSQIEDLELLIEEYCQCAGIQAAVAAKIRVYMRRLRAEALEERPRKSVLAAAGAAMLAVASAGIVDLAGAELVEALEGLISHLF